MKNRINKLCFNANFVSLYVNIASGGSMCFTDKQNEFNKQLKHHHFGEFNQDSSVPISVSRQQLIQSVRFVVFVFLLIVLTVVTVFYYNLVGNGRNKIFHKGRLAETFCCDF